MLKITTGLAMLLATAVFATDAAAQTTPVFTPTVTVTLEAEVASVCGVRFSDDAAAVTYDFGVLSDVDAGTFAPQQGGTIEVICNDVDGYAVTYASANAGFLTLNGDPTNQANRRIQYEMFGNNSPRGGFGSRRTPPASFVSNSGPFTSSATINLQYFVRGVRVRDDGNLADPQAFTTNVFAGAYRDVVTISIAGR